MESPERLHAFLYYLMRDHLPTGTVAEIIKQLPDEDDPIHYSAPELHALAYRYALKILPEPEPETEEQSAGAQAWLAHAPERILAELARERLDSGHGLTIEELATRVGWNVAKEEDVIEANGVVQSLYDRGYLMRDGQGRILLTTDGATALESGVL